MAEGLFVPKKDLKEDLLNQQFSRLGNIPKPPKRKFKDCFNREDDYIKWEFEHMFPDDIKWPQLGGETESDEENESDESPNESFLADDKSNREMVNRQISGSQNEMTLETISQLNTDTDVISKEGTEPPIPNESFDNKGLSAFENESVGETARKEYYELLKHGPWSDFEVVIQQDITAHLYTDNSQLVYRKFNIIETLYQTHYSRLSIVKCESSGERLAMKRVYKKFIERFKMVDVRELAQERSIEHENIVKFYGLYDKEDEFLVLMEPMDICLWNIFVKFYSNFKDLEFIPENFVWHVANGVLSGLSYLYKVTGKAHGDLRLTEVFVNRNGKVKLTAFNGTPIHPLHKILSRNLDVYIAPERMTKIPVATLDIRSDVWSFGKILFTLVTGRHLYLWDILSVRVLRVVMVLYGPLVLDRYLCKVSEELRHFIDSCLEPDIEYRPNLDELTKLIEDSRKVTCEDSVKDFINGIIDAKILE